MKRTSGIKKVGLLTKNEVEVEKLRWYCPAEFTFKSTAELKEPENLEDIVKGQESAKKQLKDAIRLRQNAILVGPPGCGKSLLANKLAEKYSKEIAQKEKIVLQDQVLAYNFDDSFEPVALTLPTPLGSELRDNLNNLANDIKKSGFLDKELRMTEVEKIKKEKKELKKKKEKVYEMLENVRKSSQEYYGIRRDEYFPKSVENIIEHFLNDLRTPFMTISKEEAEKMLNLNIDGIESKIEELDTILKQKRPEALIMKYEKYPKVKKFLERLIKDLRENPPKRPFMTGIVMSTQDIEEEKNLEKYKVNLIVNNNEIEGLPIQFIENPTIENMIGDVQHDPYGLGGHKPHMRAKAGKLPKANGGIAIIDELILVFEDKTLSDYLLTALEEKKVRIGGGRGLVSGGTSAGIETEPVEADCIIIGCANKDIREYTSEKMVRRFKHKILFDADMLNTKENRMAYANFIAYEVNKCNKDEKNKEKIPHFAPEAVQALVEEGVRFTTRFGNANKEKYLTNILDAMKDIVQKAGLKAVDDKENVVKRKHVEQAVADIKRPAIKEQIDFAEKVKDGTIILQTKGTKVGYVNGLVIYPDPFKTEFFGFPARLEAVASTGSRGLISTTKESKLSGEVFTKSHEVIIGYFKQKYEQDTPKFYEARLDFNQLYNYLEGDSASIATAIAYISAFSDVPAKQNIAVTGSMNQRGDVQAVGGVNEKIEGFYRLCKEQEGGMTGNQGVIIPRANVQSLMIDKELINDIQQGKFHIYAVSKLDEALEILTERAAEEIHKKVKEKLEKYTKGYVQSIYQKREEIL